MKKPSPIIDADYDIVSLPPGAKRDHWAPFRAWVAPKLWNVAITLVVFLTGCAALLAYRYFAGFYN